MPKYMLLTYLDGETNSHFSDDYTRIRNFAMNAVCGLGAYCELYERQYKDGQRFYEFVTEF